MQKSNYLQPTQQSGAALFKRQIQGEVIMLNLIHLRDTADYSEHPELAPATPISGLQAFNLYIEHSMPYLEQTGGELLMLGQGGQFFIGPEDEQWDLVMLVKQSSVASFFDFASNTDYLAGIGHRTAAIVDSRLLPFVDINSSRLS